MTVTYKAVGWNRQKKVYDLVVGGGIGLYLLAFIAIGLGLRPGITLETLLIRAFGTAAFLSLHVVLSIGPLARLDPRFLPLLYNRRHLGVMTFVLGLAHGGFAVFQFHALGNVHPLVSVLVSNPRLDSLSQFPFQPLGLLALLILFLMAATSHDFWLTQLTAPIWKRLHMAAYLVYGLLVSHVALGILQAETHPGLTVLLAAGVAWLLCLHLIAGWRERRADRPADGAALDGWVEVCRVDEIEPDRARITCLGGERVAVFRYGDRVSALSNVCQHQNGPLGEGRIINGCVVCPWHGYEYEPETGASPAPFAERVPTFNVRVIEGSVWLDPRPNPPGTRVEPAIVTEGSHG
ncbi:MAG: ferric reductase-like transmembrane domain-containing protein [Acidobacteria bacterium]|nr:ferric reductase-like transmembrane domain-containing protein [Acidobacteriota bacterium]